MTDVAHCSYCHGDNLAGDIVVNNPNTQGVIVAPKRKNTELISPKSANV